MTTIRVTWPTRDEYDLAIAQWTETIWDADIRSGTLAYDNMGILRLGGANLYVSIYKIGNWMIRCFGSKSSDAVPADIRERYMAIDRFCRTNASRVSALIPVTYLEQGITVGVRTLPIVKMPFLEGCPSLGEFIMDNYHDPAMMERLSEAWLRMIRELEAVSMAHGDLDLSNVLVEQHNTHVILRLIDYDNTWIPELAGRNQTEHGHENFQHPSFMPPHQRPYYAGMDRFSALVIYISLKMLVSHPRLYDDWGANEADRLLLSEQDYQNAGLVDSRIMQLRSLSTPDMYPYIDELNASLREGRMPQGLDDIAYMTQFIARPLITSQPGQAPVFINAPAPVALWKEAVYSTNSAFASPSHLPSPSPWNGRVSMPPSVPSWQYQGGYQQAGADMEKVAAPAWQPHSPAYTPYWNYGNSNPQTPPPVQSWNPGAIGSQNSLPYWETPVPASGPVPINNDMSIASSRESAKTQRKRRVFLFLAICLLAVIILGASIALVYILINSHHIGTITLPIATLRAPTYSISVNPMTTMQTLQEWSS